MTILRSLVYGLIILSSLIVGQEKLDDELPSDYWEAINRSIMDSLGLGSLHRHSLVGIDTDITPRPIHGGDSLLIYFSSQDDVWESGINGIVRFSFKVEIEGIAGEVELISNETNINNNRLRSILEELIANSEWIPYRHYDGQSPEYKEYAIRTTLKIYFNRYERRVYWP